MTEVERSVETLKTAGIIVIGDEILKGHTKDENAAFLLHKLWNNGIDTKKVSFILDDINEIANEVKLFSNSYDFVMTCGGVGPTHDDVTIAGISLALDDPLEINKELKLMMIKLLEDKSEKINENLIEQMSILPKSAKLLVGINPSTKKPAKYPLILVKNVYIFPGVPTFLQKSFLMNSDVFKSGVKFHLIKIYLSISEEFVKGSLDKIDKRFSKVSVGSYPVLNCMYKVKVSLESVDLQDLNSAYKCLMELLPTNAVISAQKCLPNSRYQSVEIFRPAVDQSKRVRNLSVSCLNFVSRLDLEGCLSKTNLSSLASSVKITWAILKQTYSIYSPEEVCIGFTGGKDCTVLLHMMVAFTSQYFQGQQQQRVGIYLKSASPFEETKLFISDCEQSYNLKMVYIQGTMKEGLQKFKTSHPSIKAVMMGTRRDDPYSAHLKSFVVTDPGWPEYMRVLPILDWSYNEVWEFLRVFNLPYCSLYDEGYTSLGGIENTSKNPELLLQDGTYAPAYTLNDDTNERSGRN